MVLCHLQILITLSTNAIMYPYQGLSTEYFMKTAHTTVFHKWKYKKILNNIYQCQVSIALCVISMILSHVSTTKYPPTQVAAFSSHI
jgi:hypothetical protein